jgi:Mrp family chromosome partitioning ATPase
MDALRYAMAKGNRKLGISDADAVRMEIANALRDMADEIEHKMRLVTGMQTFEQTQDGLPPVSILHVTSVKVVAKNG